MEKIRWGIIGCGDVTEVKSGPALQKADGSELVAVMRRNGDLAKDYALRHGVERWYNDAASLINDPQVDAIYIATPPSSHKEYTFQVARAGKPVYVEKPMALNFKECKEMVDTCKKFKVPLFVAYYRRALPRFQKIKELLEDKAIGEVRSVNVRLYKPASHQDIKMEYNWRVEPSVSGGGYFFDLACHMIDLLHFFIGPIVAVNGFKTNQARLYKAEDIVIASFAFENNVLGTGVWCFTADTNFEETEIIGTDGRITYSNFMETPIILSRTEKVEQFEIAHPKHIQLPLIQRVVDELMGKGISPSRGTTAIKTNWVMDQILLNSLL